MSSVAEIEAVLPKLSSEELVQLERALHDQYRQRHCSIIYDDNYGVTTDADLIASADAAFVAYDKEEEAHAHRKAR